MFAVYRIGQEGAWKEAKVKQQISQTCEKLLNSSINLKLQYIFILDKEYSKATGKARKTVHKAVSMRLIKLQGQNGNQKKKYLMTCSPSDMFY